MKENLKIKWKIIILTILFSSGALSIVFIKIPFNPVGYALIVPVIYLIRPICKYFGPESCICYISAVLMVVAFYYLLFSKLSWLYNIFRDKKV